MMYAIVDIAGQQFKVQKDQKIYVHRLDGETGSKVDFKKVLLIENDQNVIVGTPIIEGAMVYASILEHKKDDKVLVFKKKRKKGYRKLNGHRQCITQILIEDIIEQGAKARVTAEKPKTVTTKKIKEETGVLTDESSQASISAAKKDIPAKPEEKKTARKSPAKKTVKPSAKSAEAVTKTTEKKKTAPKKPVTDKKEKAPAKAEKPAEKKTGIKKAK